MAEGSLQESLLETPTYTLAIVFLCLQGISILFTVTVNTLKRILRAYNRPGMVVAVDHSVWELTIVGFISLCLIAAQSTITSICVDARASRSDWSILQHVYGNNNCPCCLRDTASIQPCIIESSGCGNINDPFCNCNEMNATCIESTYPQSVEEALIQVQAEAQQANVSASNIPQSYHYCEGSVTVPSSCGPGKIPAVSFLALEQVHLLIFTIAVVHVFCGFLLYLAASARLWFQWSRWNRGDDKHSQVVQKKLEEYFAGLDQPNVSRLLLPPNTTAGSLQQGKDAKVTMMTAMQDARTTTATEGFDTNFGTHVQMMNDDLPSNSVENAQIQSVDAGLPASNFKSFSRKKNNDTEISSSMNTLTRASTLRKNRFSTIVAAVAEAAGIDLETGRRDPLRDAIITLNQRQQHNQRNVHTTTTNTTNNSNSERSIKEENQVKKINHNDDSDGLVGLSRYGSAPLPDLLTIPPRGLNDFTAAAEELGDHPKTAHNNHDNNDDCYATTSEGGAPNAEQKSIPNKIRATCTDIFEYILDFVGYGIITYDRYAIMRASYIYTHKLSASFAFLDHVQRNLEDDLSHIVGLSVEFWVVIVLFILISGPFGYAVMPFMTFIAFVLTITNVKLVSIAKTVTSRGGVGRLTSRIFWFNRPQLLLIPIKLVLFICSFIYASFIFFAWQFGPKSCPFSNGFYPLWVINWWWIVVFNTVIFINMAVVTLPTYSLVVLMGSELKSHMLPKRFKKKLLMVAARAKEKVRAEKALSKSHPSSAPMSPSDPTMPHGSLRAPAGDASLAAAGVSSRSLDAAAAADAVVVPNTTTGMSRVASEQDSLERRESTFSGAVQGSKVLFQRAMSRVARHLVGEHHVDE